jgi:SAM-dependent methyltransferase
LAWISDTDSEWKKWGEQNPYFAVLSSPRYRCGENTIEFFQTGQNHFTEVNTNFKRLGIPLDPIGVALDFGCGVGRVLKPLCGHFRKVIGVDVSPAMLAEARKQVESERADFRLLDGDDLSGCLSGDTFHFVHSHIVFQHIRPRRGRILLRALLGSLEPAGKAYIHVPIASANRLKYFADQVVASHPVLLRLSRALLGKRALMRDPVMQMNVYPAEQLLELFAEEGVEIRYVSLLKDTKNQLTHACWYLHKP